MGTLSAYLHRTAESLNEMNDCAALVQICRQVSVERAQLVYLSKVCIGSLAVVSERLEHAAECIVAADFLKVSLDIALCTFLYFLQNTPSDADAQIFEAITLRGPARAYTIGTSASRISSTG